MDKSAFYLFILITLDQIVKYITPGSKNYGAAFGILQGYRILFIIVGIIVVFLVVYYRNRLENIGLYGGLLLLSGTIGNLIDRIFLGYVRDFIDLGFWPSFNLADSYSTIGAILLVIYFWKK